MIVAVDGPAAAGKGTLARRLAKAYDLAYLDTGALYRATALSLLLGGDDPSDSHAAAAASSALDLSILGHKDLRAEATGGAASIVAAQPRVRANLLAFQRDFAASPPDGKRGAILDGRDIGTVVCPDADLKIYVTASAEERARRRCAEMENRGQVTDFEEILKDVVARDARDMNRADAPLKPAADAHLLDTTDLDIEAAFNRACALVKQAL